MSDSNPLITDAIERSNIRIALLKSLTPAMTGLSTKNHNGVVELLLLIESESFSDGTTTQAKGYTLARTLKCDRRTIARRSKRAEAAGLLDTERQYYDGGLERSKRRTINWDRVKELVRPCKRTTPPETETAARCHSAMTPDIPGVTPDIPGVTPDIPGMTPDIPSISYSSNNSNGNQRSCSERNAHEPTELVFPLKGGGSWELTPESLSRYVDAFDDIDVASELKLALLWCEDNQAKRKTAAGMPAFLTRWLNRARQPNSQVVRGQQSRGPVITPGTRFDPNFKGYGHGF